MVVLYNFYLILGQNQQQQAPLQIAAGCPSSISSVPKTNRCIIQILIKPGTKPATAGPFHRLLQAVDPYLVLSPKQMVSLYNFHLILGQNQQQQAPLQIAVGSQSLSSFVPKTNRCIIQLPFNPGTKPAAAGPFTDCCRLSICPQNKWMCYTTPNYCRDKSSSIRPLYRLL